MVVDLSAYLANLHACERFFVNSMVEIIEIGLG
jgi:hypothetical protein